LFIPLFRQLCRVGRISTVNFGNVNDLSESVNLL
jgi:hypothetical protein